MFVINFSLPAQVPWNSCFFLRGITRLEHVLFFFSLVFCYFVHMFAIDKIRIPVQMPRNKLSGSRF